MGIESRLTPNDHDNFAILDWLDEINASDWYLNQLKDLDFAKKLSPTQKNKLDIALKGFQDENNQKIAEVLKTFSTNPVNSTIKTVYDELAESNRRESHIKDILQSRENNQALQPKSSHLNRASAKAHIA